MRRIVTILSCLAVLCIAALVVWLYQKRNGQGDVPEAERRIGNSQASNTSAGPIEKKTLDRRVFALPVSNAYSDDEQFPCYIDAGNTTLYRWKGVVLSAEQVPTAYKGVISGLRTHTAKDFTVIPIEAPVKYWYWNDGEGYRPGYLDRSSRAFYAWKGIVLNKEELLDNSQDSQTALVDPDKVSEVIEIDMPAHLTGRPELWKKGGAYTPEASVRAEKRAAEKKEAEKTEAEERARDPRVFSLDVWVTTFGENEFSPCYYDPANRSLYRWKGVVLRLEQLPEIYKKRQKVLGDVRALPLLVVLVETPVKYRKVKGGYRPGYVDPTCQTFYEWKGVMLSKQELLDKSKDGQAAIVDPDKFREVIEIDMPAHLKEQPRLWKKT